MTALVPELAIQPLFPLCCEHASLDMKSPARMGLARLIAFLVATTFGQSAFSLVIGAPVVPQGASINTSVIQVQPGIFPAMSQTGTGNGQVLDDGLGYATALYTGDDGSVVAKIRAGGGGNDENAQASVTWFFMVIGPPEAATVPVYVPLYFQGHGLLSVQGLNSYYNHYEDAFATASVISSLPGFSNGPASLTKNGINGFNLSMGGLALAYQTYSITLKVGVESGGDDTAAVEADLDPLIEVESDFAAEGYSLVSSAVPPIYGQAPTESVPEPSTDWMMLAGGIGLVTIGTRRRGRAGASGHGVDGFGWTAMRPGP